MTKKKSSEPLNPPCPCGSGLTYENCCGHWHHQPAKRKEPTALTLMRARYSAYVLGEWVYLNATWHPDTRPVNLSNDDERLAWQRLQIIATEAGGIDDATGIVEFVAIYKAQGRAYKLHERSRFVRDANGAWLYLDGDVN